MSLKSLQRQLNAFIIACGKKAEAQDKYAATVHAETQANKEAIINAEIALTDADIMQIETEQALTDMDLRVLEIEVKQYE